VTQQSKLPAGDLLSSLPSARRKTVLVVEDNELNMKLFHDRPETRGHKVVQTRNGAEALTLARQHGPNLIIMDIQLPEVSGLEVTKWIKDDDALKAMPIIAVTAFAMKGDEERIRESGCEAYITKPMSVTNFINTVERFLRYGDLSLSRFVAIWIADILPRPAALGRASARNFAAPQSVASSPAASPQ
jgi:two-component system cell cycle response regulator DivK